MILLTLAELLPSLCWKQKYETLGSLYIKLIEMTQQCQSMAQSPVFLNLPSDTRGLSPVHLEKILPTFSSSVFKNRHNLYINTPSYLVTLPPWVSQISHTCCIYPKIELYKLFSHYDSLIHWVKSRINSECRKNMPIQTNPIASCVFNIIIKKMK